MNIIRLFLGGHPFTEDDIRFLESAYTEGLKALSFPFAKQNNGYMILDGCKPVKNTTLSNQTTDTYDVSEGYLLYDYEVLRCEPHQVSVPYNSDLEYILKVDYLPSGTTVYFNAVPHETHERRTVIIQEYTQIGVDVASMKTYAESVMQLLQNNIKVGASNIVFEPDWSANTANSISVKDTGLTISLTGGLITSQSFRTAIGPHTELVGTLPINLRPLFDIVIPCKLFAPINVIEIGYLYLSPSGAIFLEKLQSSAFREATIHVTY